MLSRLHTLGTSGLKVNQVDVEVDISRGLHSFSIVGLADKAVGEARDRINAAIKNSGFKPPVKGNRKVIVSLAPADIKKEGTNFDLAIALAYLLAAGDIKFNSTKKIFLGELALNGELRPIKGALLLSKKAEEMGFDEIYLPTDNALEAALIRGVKIFGCANLRQIINHLSPSPVEKGGEVPVWLSPQPATTIPEAETDAAMDFADVRGQSTAKRGLEIAAAGGHNVAMYGPPGTGKTMLAKAFIGVLPALSYDEILEATGIHSVAGVLTENLITRPPLRSPHHTSSYISIVGGGTWPKPGEITLAHRGVLFLDEFPEFEKRVIESLRQPLEDKVINISRSKGSTIFPANFILIATMNPCPCGNRGLRTKECLCSAHDIMRYQKKLSGPIVDRIDLWLEVPQIDPTKLSEKSKEEPSIKVRERILSAREKQLERFRTNDLKIKTNGEMGNRELAKFAPLSEICTKLLNDSARRLDLSARSYHKIIRLARTIADLADSANIKEDYLLEALQYRPKISM